MDLEKPLHLKLQNKNKKILCKAPFLQMNAHDQIAHDESPLLFHLSRRRTVDNRTNAI